MKLELERGRKRQAAFSLVEVMLASALVTMLIVANMAAISFHRVCNTKEKEMGIMTDFCIHYMELVRSLPFQDIQGGEAINALYNGANGAPNIRIPSSTNWVALSTNYQNFHPELVWIEKRNPQMRVLLTTTKKDGLDHTKYMHLEVRWDPPLGQGHKLNYSLDMVRVRDL